MPRIAKPKECPVCHVQFYGKNKYCSTRCYQSVKITAQRVICENCGKEVSRRPSIIKKHVYCSHECYVKANTNRVIIQCVVCNSPFEVKAYRKDTARFCSRSCASKFELSHRKMINPNLKGNQFRKGKRPTNAFTSEQVRGNNSPSWVDPITKTCINCGSEFSRKPWEFNRKGIRGDFCCQKCRYEYLVGDRNPLWQGGETTYRGKGWKQIRMIVVTNQGGVCADCGKYVGDGLPVHHIKPFREFETAAEANQIENLIGLCQSCHMKREPRKTTLK